MTVRYPFDSYLTMYVERGRQGRLAPGQFERTASQPMFGRLTVMQWLRSYYRHDRMHRDQMAGREPEYRPRFVGGREPDQRRGPQV